LTQCCILTTITHKGITMTTEIIDETRTFIILHKHGEKPKTLRVPLVTNGVFQMLNETYTANPTARVEVLTIEIEKSEGDMYHVYKSGVDVYPIVRDGKDYLANYVPVVVPEAITEKPKKKAKGD
jgi:hypothetical protein